MQIEVLTAEWLEGITSREIGLSLGVSAEAVRCKRRQLGLPSRAGEITREARAHAGRNRRSLTPQMSTAPAPRLDRLAPLLGSMPRPWLDRAFGECAFPVEGEGAETRSCCLPVARAGYCAGHGRIMWGAS